MKTQQKGKVNVTHMEKFWSLIILMSNTVKTSYTGSSQMSFTVSGSKKEEEILRWQHKVQWNHTGIQYRAENKCIEKF